LCYDVKTLKETEMIDNDPSGCLGCLSCIFFMGFVFVIVASCVGMGKTFSKPEHIELGRTEGIKFCNEKPKECKYEYDYMQYLKTQQNQK
jgi:hypothetical protein